MAGSNIHKGESADKARSPCYGSECYTSPMSVKSIEVDAYVFDTLMRDLIAHDHFASAFVTYLLLWRKSLGAGEASVRISLRDIAEGTGLSKRGVQQAIGVLSRRKLIGISRASITDIPVYTVHRPWRRR